MFVEVGVIGTDIVGWDGLLGIGGRNNVLVGRGLSTLDAAVDDGSGTIGSGEKSRAEGVAGSTCCGRGLLARGCHDVRGPAKAVLDRGGCCQ